MPDPLPGTGGAASWTLWCPRCDASGGHHTGFRCPTCHGPRQAVPPPGLDIRPRPEGPGMWRYRSALPPVARTVSLAEGDTPLLDFPHLAEEVGVAGVRIKDETRNPTLSFKDRAMSLGLGLALAAGAPAVVAASTGNTAVSAAAYAARAGLPCHLVCAESASEGPKALLARALGAHLRPVPGDYSAAHRAAADLEDRGWYPLTTTFRNPFTVEAHRTVAFELARQAGARVPDWILVPVGAGPLLWGVHQGYAALREAGAVDRVPRLVAVQAAACAPIARAVAEGDDLPRPAEPRPTMAGAIADPMRGYADEGAATLRAIRESGGTAVAVPEKDIRDSVRLAAHRCGLLLEPAAAAPLAAIGMLRRDGTVPPSAEAVVLATGHGAKEPGHLPG